MMRSMPIVFALFGLVACESPISTGVIDGPPIDPNRPLATSITVVKGSAATCPITCRTSVGYSVIVRDQFGHPMDAAAVRWRSGTVGATTAASAGASNALRLASPGRSVRDGRAVYYVSLPSLAPDGLYSVDDEILQDSIVVNFIPDLLNGGHAYPDQLIQIDSMGTVAQNADSIYGRIKFADLNGFAGTQFVIIGSQERPGAPWITSDTIWPSQPVFVYDTSVARTGNNTFGFRFYNDSTGQLIGAVNAGFHW